MKSSWHSRFGTAVMGVLLMAASLPGCMGGGALQCSFPDADVSAARIWNEVALDAIRRDFPAPTVHARNLYHLSGAMWDVWRAWGDVGQPLFVNAADATIGFEATEDKQREADRAEAVTFAAHTILSRRYERAVGAPETLAQIDATLERLCGSRAFQEPDEGSPAAFGVQVARAVLEGTVDDGSFEASNYDDFSYVPVNPPLVVSEPGAEMVDPARWQPLSLSTVVTQNGIPLPAAPQTYIGPSWGKVTPFALDAEPVNGLPIDPGAPPTLASDPEAWFEGIVDVLSFSARLDADTEVSDRLRVIAEYWADGPDSETPPGHWNLVATDAADALAARDNLRVAGGDLVNRLEFDVKLYLALNGANHDAAIAAWGTKARYDYARPISMIRYAAGLGQSSDDGLPRYDPAGLPLVDGLIEQVTQASSAAGGRHAHLVSHVDEIVVLAWTGTPVDPATQTAGVDWIRGVEWLPYQRPDFVSPAFASYVSGHSAFSRASAEVLTGFTGSEVFPGGSFSHVVEPGGLIHESGPTETVTLTWITYREAADEAGISRRAGGIHVPADDLVGRELGAEVGALAWARAQELFAGS